MPSLKHPGVVIASAFPAIVVFAQELVPGRVGLIAGIFFGFAFGSGAIAAAALGVVADLRSIEFVFALTAWMPILGVLTLFLPRAAAMAASPVSEFRATASTGDRPEV